MKKRKKYFINKNTSNVNKTLKKKHTSRKKLQKEVSSLLGWLQQRGKRGQLRFVPFQPNFHERVKIKPQDIQKHRCEDRTIVRVSLTKAKKGSGYEGRIEEVIPSIDDPSFELDLISEIHGFPVSISKKALDEAEAQTKRHSPKREDLQNELTVTIDDESAKDFDDAISVKKLNPKLYSLKVSIADVSFYVPENSPLDREALTRATSIYFPGYAIPMLPEILSNDVCSLVPHQRRYALTCEMKISNRGNIQSTKIYPSIIRSDARLTYNLVSEVIEEGKNDKVAPAIVEMLNHAHQLSLILRKHKRQRGFFELELPEMKIQVNDYGEVLKIGYEKRNEAHKLIEDFMIAANEAVSDAIESKGYASIFRVHESPDPLKLEKLKETVKRWGFRFRKKTVTVSELQEYLESIREHPHEKILALSFLRSMKQAQYSANNLGHYGLGSSSYCHFTSPIRRYPDLMIHRILRKSGFLKAKKSPYDVDQLKRIAELCSEREQRAAIAERDMKDLKSTRFMTQHVGKEFVGLITSVKSFGFFVEIEPFFVDGLVHIRSLPYDRWEVDDLEISLKGRRSKKVFHLGDKIRIQVSHVDRLRRQITFRYLRHEKT